MLTNAKGAVMFGYLETLKRSQEYVLTARVRIGTRQEREGEKPRSEKKQNRSDTL